MPRGSRNVETGGERVSIKREALTNGLTLIVHENPTDPLVTLRCIALGGPVEEPPAQAGLASFTADMLMRGTERMTFEQINLTLEERGIFLSTGASRHSCDAAVHCLTEDLTLATELLADVVRRPTFPEKNVETRRGQIITGLRQEDNDTGAVADRAFREAAYPEGHPYRRRIDGYEPIICALTRDQLAGFHRRHLHPVRMFIAVSGDVLFEQLRDRLAQVFGDWQAPGNSAMSATPGSTARASWLDIPGAPKPAAARLEKVVPGKTQSDLVIGFPALRRTDPEYYALQLGTAILGQLGLQGRLGASLRERQGLAYHVGSYMESAPAPAPWAVRAGVNPANVDRAIAGILEEVRRLSAESVTEEELSGIKQHLVGTLTLQLETNDGIASLLQAIEFYGLGLDYADRYPHIIRSVSQDEILLAAQAHVDPEGPVIVVAGPAREPNG